MSTGQILQTKHMPFGVVAGLDISTAKQQNTSLHCSLAWHSPKRQHCFVGNRTAPSVTFLQRLLQWLRTWHSSQRSSSGTAMLAAAITAAYASCAALRGSLRFFLCLLSPYASPCVQARVQLLV
jgi:hypothetical protein